MMTTALFFGVPAYGHVNPSLSLVAELVERGHRVVYILTESFRATVEALGAGLLLRKQAVTVESLRAYAHRLLSEPRFKTEAVRVGDSFRAAQPRA